ncbi:MAG: Gfo/Idh/MocA family oxidoreductase [Chloroflexi bacterium]|nr:Gfo/Idh/MocA family oxidoreductase [Chloroflexota bacterium]
MNDQEIKLGVVGAGRHGRDMGRAARESGRFDLVVCCDVVPELALQAKDWVGYGHSVTSMEKMLEFDLDAVLVATSHDALAETASQAARAGNHVYVEKPLALTAEQAAGVVAATSESGVNLMVGYCLRYLPSRVEMKRQIDSGAVGEMVGITSGKAGSRYLTGPLADPNRGGGALLFVGSHQIDQLLWLTGEMPETVAGKVTYVPENGTDDTSWFTLEFPSGLVAQAFCSQNSGAVIDYVDVMGTHGKIRADYPTNEVWIQSQVNAAYRDRTYIVKAPPIMPENWPTPMSNIYVEEIVEFADSIAEGRAPDIPGEAAVDVLRVIDAIKRSSDLEGEKIEL